MSIWNNQIKADSEPLRVLIKRGDFIDKNRGDRTVPYKLYYPDIHHNKNDNTLGIKPPFPLIIWSHGLGGTRDGAAFIARFIASHGYVLAHIQHDGSDDSLWRNEEGHPWDVIRRKTPIPYGVTRNRYLDVSFALDEIIKLIKSDETLHHITNTQNIGMSGHSFGALTTQVMAGQVVGDGDVPERFKEPRFKAGILYSPTPNFRTQLPLPQIYGPIDMPLLHMTGTNDDSPVEKFGYEKRREVFDHAEGKNQHFFAIDGADHMVFNGSRGKLDNYDDIETDKDIIKLISLAWWDAFLKGDKAAYDWLHTGGPETLWRDNKVQHRHK